MMPPPSRSVCTGLWHGCAVILHSPSMHCLDTAPPSALRTMHGCHVTPLFSCTPPFHQPCPGHGAGPMGHLLTRGRHPGAGHSALPGPIQGLRLPDLRLPGSGRHRRVGLQRPAGGRQQEARRQVCRPKGLMPAAALGAASPLPARSLPLPLTSLTASVPRGPARPTLNLMY